jgi:hypothetical protein
VVPMYLLIFLLAFDRGLIAEALRARWLRKLEEWSFAIYMVQFIVLILLPFAGLRSIRCAEATLAVLGAAVAGGPRASVHRATRGRDDARAVLQTRIEMMRCPAALSPGRDDRRLRSRPRRAPASMALKGPSRLSASAASVTAKSATANGSGRA